MPAVRNDLTKENTAPFSTNELRASRILGMFCEHSWVFCVFFAMATRLGTKMIGFTSLFYVVSFVTLGIFLFCAAILYKSIDSFFDKRCCQPFIIVSLSVGSVLLFLFDGQLV
ncbi:MAG: hypothetical protein IJJ14_06335, partial [Coriobacteriales bacterium]|nr:hypothetical protein [Coriobacteriales bacterium]